MKATITIEGMSCKHCTGSVEKALKAIPGLTGVSVSLADKNAIVEGDDSVSEAAISAAITDLGFTVLGISK